MGRFGWTVGSAVLLSGCLQLEQTVTLEADGSGTQELVMTMPAETLDRTRRAAQVDQVAASDPTALFEEAKVRRELEVAGLELREHRAERIGGARQVHMTAAFGSPDVLRRSPLAGSRAEWEFAPGPVPGTVEVTLYPQGREAWAEARRRAMEAGDGDPVAIDFFERRREQLAGLSVSLRFKLPGPVLRHTRNLERTGECEVTASITEDQIRTPQDLMRRLAPRYQVVFDASGCERFPVDG